MAYKKWTEDEEERLLGMIDLGLSYKAIAYLLDRSYYSVWGKAHYNEKMLRAWKKRKSPASD